MSLLVPREVRSSFAGDPSYNPFERPSVPLESLALDGILGGGTNSNDAGENVNQLAGMTLPTAYRCISILATVVASCTLEVIDKAGAASPWADFQGLQSYTAYEIAELIVTHMAGWGNFYGRKLMLNGKLIDLQPIYPGNVTVRRVRGQKIFRVRKQLDPNTANPVPQPNQGEWVEYTEDDVLHIPFLGYDGLQGMSPIMAAAQTIGTSIAADRLAARFHSRGQQLGGVIKVKAPLASQDQADAIKFNWRRSHGGVRHSGDVAVLDSETDFQPITINPNDLQLIEGRTWQANEIARIFGVPLTMLSFASTGYGDAIETQQIGFVTYTVRGYTDRIEQRLTREFMPRGKTLAFDLDDLMRGSMTERYLAYNTAIAGGWMLRSEARESESMPELAPKYGLDEPLVPQAVNGQITPPPLAVPSAEPPVPAPAPDADGEADADDADSQDANSD